MIFYQWKQNIKKMMIAIVGCSRAVEDEIEPEAKTKTDPNEENIVNDDTDQDKTEYLDDYVIEEVTDTTVDDNIVLVEDDIGTGEDKMQKEGKPSENYINDDSEKNAADIGKDEHE